jgi:hypothetical protein
VQLGLLAADPSLSAFSALLQQSALLGVLRGPGPFTLFVPSNRALDDAATALAAFARPEAAALLYQARTVWCRAPQPFCDACARSRARREGGFGAQLLASHLALGVRKLGGVAQPAAVTAVSGAVIFANSTYAITAAAAAAIVGVDVLASNGVVHIVDALIVPPDIGGTARLLSVSVPTLRAFAEPTELKPKPGCGCAELRMLMHAHAATICESGCLGALADVLDSAFAMLPEQPHLAAAARSARALEVDSCAIVGLTSEQCFGADAVGCKVRCTHCAREHERQERRLLPPAHTSCPAPSVPRPGGVPPRPVGRHVSSGRDHTRSVSRSNLSCANCGAACTGAEPCLADRAADACAAPLAVECLAECSVCAPPERPPVSFSFESHLAPLKPALLTDACLRAAS